MGLENVCVACIKKYKIEDYTKAYPAEYNTDFLLNQFRLPPEGMPFSELVHKNTHICYCCNDSRLTHPIVSRPLNCDKRVYGWVQVRVTVPYRRVESTHIKLCHDLHRLRDLESKVNALTDMLAPILASESYKEAQNVINSGD